MVVTLAAIAAAAVSLAVRTPIYKATAQMLVTPLPQDDRTFLGITLLRDSGDPTRTMQTAAALIVSPGVARLTAQQLGGDTTQGSVESAIKVEPLGESNILAVTGQASSAERAAALANGYARSALQLRSATLRVQIDAAIAALQRDQQPAGTALSAADATLLAELTAVRDRGDPSLSLSKPAERPSGPTNTPDWLILALGLIAGVTLGAIVAVLLERFDPRVRDADELVSLAPVPILARVPTVLRRRRVYALLVAPAVRESFQTLQILLDQRRLGNGRRSNTVVITSASSGDGKTTTAICLSLALVAAGHEVILIDCDLRRPDIAPRLGLDHSRGLATLLSTPATLAELLQPVDGLPKLQVLTDGASDVRLLPGALSKVIEEARSLADYVIVDTASLGVVGDALAFVQDADELLLVGRVNHSDRRAVWNMVELLERADATATGWVIIGDDNARQSNLADAPATLRNPTAPASAPAGEPTAPAPAKPRSRRAPAAAAKRAAPKASPSEPEAPAATAPRTPRPRRKPARPVVAPAPETPPAAAAPAPVEEVSSPAPEAPPEPAARLVPPAPPEPAPAPVAPASGDRASRPEHDAAAADQAAVQPHPRQRSVS